MPSFQLRVISDKFKGEPAKALPAVDRLLIVPSDDYIESAGSARHGRRPAEAGRALATGGPAVAGIGEAIQTVPSGRSARRRTARRLGSGDGRGRRPAA